MIYDKYPKYKNPPNHALGVLGGMLIGALVGAVAMLFLVPRSGKETRTQIQKKGVELRDRANEMMEDTLAQIGVNPNKIKMGVNRYEQLEDVSNAG